MTELIKNKIDKHLNESAFRIVSEIADSMNRECYMAGVLLATRYVNENNEFIYGLDNIMN